MRIFAFRRRLGTFESYMKFLGSERRQPFSHCFSVSKQHFSDIDESSGHLVKCRFWSSRSGVGSETAFLISSQGLSMSLAQRPHVNSKVLKKCSKEKGKHFEAE